VLDWDLFPWTSSRVQVFGELLQRFPCPRLAGFTPQSGGGMEAVDYYSEPEHYLYNAAR
jgi:hypothetical protein